MVTWLVAALALAYPLLAYFGLLFGSPALVAAVLMGLLLIRLKWHKSGLFGPYVNVVAVMIVLVLGVSVLTNSNIGIRFYPVMVNLMLLTLFVSSLFFPPPIIERLARLQQPDLPPSGVTYTRKITMIWSVFFLLNGSIALGTAVWADMQTWALYNGFIAYLLMGGLGAGEWLIRRRVIKQHDS